MTPEEIEAFFLDHDDPIYEQIQEADSEDEAEGIADDALAAAHPGGWDKWDLIKVIRKIRGS